MCTPIYRINSQTFSGCKKCACRQIEQKGLSLQVETSPKAIFLHRPTLGSTHNQQISVRPGQATAQIQFPCVRSKYRRYRCFSSTESKQENNWVSSPFWLIPQVLDVVCKQNAEATMIAPAWKGQRWYQKLLSLMVAPPLRLQNSSRTFLQLYALPESRKNPKWKIFA